MSLITIKKMKLFKSSIFASIALAAALTGCSDDDKYNVGGASNGAYFPEGLEESVEASNEVSVYNIPVYRVNADSPSTYTVTSTISLYDGQDVTYNPEGISIPSSVSFSGSELQTSLPITYDVDKVQQDVAYNITVSLSDASDYGDASYSFEFTVTAPKVREAWDGTITSNGVTYQGRNTTGKATFYEQYAFGTASLSYEIEYNPNIGKDKSFTVVAKNAYDYYDNNTGLDFRIEIPDVNEVDENGWIICNVKPFGIGYTHPTYGEEIYCSDVYNYIKDDSRYDAETIESWRTASAYNPETGTFYLMLIYYVSEGAFDNQYHYFQLDGYPECGVSVSYNGLYTDTEDNTYAIANISSESDVASIKAAALLDQTVPSELSKAVKMVESSSNVQEIEPGTNVRGLFPVSEDGTYLILAISYDSDGVAQDFGYAYATISMGAGSDWESIGNATYYDGWFLPCCTEDYTLFPFEVPLRKSKSEKGVYQLVGPYNNTRFPGASINEYGEIRRDITFTIVSNDYVEVLPQLAGVGTSKVAEGASEFMIANLEGLYYSGGNSREDIAAYMDAKGYDRSVYDADDNVVIIPIPYFSFDGGDQFYIWNGDVDPITYIFFPEASESARAKVVAKSIAAPKITKLTTIVNKKASLQKANIDKFAFPKKGLITRR